jgi:hypothetical protein
MAAQAVTPYRRGCGTITRIYWRRSGALKAKNNNALIQLS